MTLLLLALFACSGDSGPKIDDADGDGVAAADDCDDTDAEVYPDAPERCNDADDDCDDEIDEGLAVTFYPDADGDTYGDMNAPVEDCSQPTGTVTNGEDCDDTAIAVNPAAVEVCDGIDNNCAGGVDEGVKTTFYRDADGDTYGNPSVTQDACSAPSGYVVTGGDCDDTEAARNPTTVWYADADGDGRGDAASKIGRAHV